MCGINGIYNHKSLKDVENKVKLMNSLTKHRGPDYSNIYLDSSVCIGHNRLSIIDLDSKSNQPFISEDENLVLSYNGEIYNFLELKEKLSKSYDFKTKSYTEVIIAAYSLWGIEMVYKFNGMFSFALWDKSKEELFLCRDRFGIKPLYYIEVNQSIIFSSSIKALKSFSHEELKIKEDDLLDFLQYGTVHQPNTILDKVKSVPRGSFLMAGNQETKIFEYWNFFESNNSNKIISEPLKTVNKLLLESVEKRLISDVPYGIFLSGGIDSSILVAAASKVSTQKVNTFSIVFKEKGFDERKFSRQIASKYKTNHLELELNPEEILQQIEEPFKFMDHPSVDGINTFFISKQVHNQGFKMALSGAGSDELFAGYPVFKEVFELENKKWLYSFPPQLRNIFGKLLQLRNKSLKSHKIAEILNKLMTKNLEYKNYMAQGGDWGATIANWIGYDHSKSCKAIHINCLTMRHADGPQSKQEEEWQKRFDKDQIMQDGYRTQQATKPQTLSYGMMDSPVGIAAWIIEKMYSWSDLKDGDIESAYSKDTLLANIMVYIVTKTFNTASWIYYGRREEGGRFFPKEFKKIEIPTAAAIFPAEMSEWPPRSYVDRMFNITQWTEMPRGGHFAALEEPELLVNDLVKFSRSVR